ncbi:MAG: hypothetical protein CME40_11160 [Haliea sp.]|nr:hypothetical protein [Haliea sp.]|tara:strand:- start:32013 stop:32690 length:678 start_codon:yes stop_codon:yes gene_type:complete
MGKKTEQVQAAITGALDDLDDASITVRMMKALHLEGDSNTNEKAYEIRELLESPGIDDYPSLDSLEDSWRVLSNYYGEWDGKPLIDRVEIPDRTAGSPIENFQFHVESGFYPPPEIMILIQRCFQKYLAMGGDISLDEAFFGEPYKKRTSFAYRRHQIWRYAAFHNLEVVLHQGHLQQTGQPKKSLEQLAEDYLSSLFSGDDAGIDVDTFLRGYRRWKRDHGFTT